MSILDNEGPDPQGLGNTPRASTFEVLCACTDSCALKAENERMRSLLELIERRDAERNLFDCPSGGWIRQEMKALKATNQQTEKDTGATK